MSSPSKKMTHRKKIKQSGGKKTHRKKIKQSGGKKTHRKKINQSGGNRVSKNKSINRSKLQIGGSIKPIMGNPLYILENDIIEFLPSSKLMEIDAMHYLKMIDYQKLANIVENNSEYKKSPSIQELFNYNSISINEENKLTFSTEKIKCKNILNNTRRTYYLRVLFFYLLECNLIRESNQNGGANPNQDKMPAPDMAPPPPQDKMPAPDMAPPPPQDKMQAPDMSPQDKMQAPDMSPQDKMQYPDMGPQDKMQYPDMGPQPPQDKMQAPDMSPQDKMQYPDMGPQPQQDEMEDSNEKGDEDNIILENIEIVNQEKVPGFSEYEKMRDKLNIGDEMIKDENKISLSNSNFVFHKVNWFNVCLGIDEMDISFENKVSSELKNMGLLINKDKHKDKINELLKNGDMKIAIKSAIHTRLLECSKKPQTFIDRLRKRISYDSCFKCDLRDSNSILHLYDEYKALLNENTSTLNNIDLTIILVICEVRQRLLSFNISLEILRNNNLSKGEVNKLIKKIYKLDIPLINEKNKEINQKIIDNNEIMRKKYEEQERLIIEQQRVIDNNKLLQQRINENREMDDKQIQEIKDNFKSSNLENQAFIDEMNNKLNNEMNGGSEMIIDDVPEEYDENIVDEEEDNNNELLFSTTELNNKNKCSSISNSNSIGIDDLIYIDKCDKL